MGINSRNETNDSGSRLALLRFFPSFPLKFEISFMSMVSLRDGTRVNLLYALDITDSLFALFFL